MANLSDQDIDYILDHVFTQEFYSIYVRHPVDHEVYEDLKKLYKAQLQKRRNEIHIFYKWLERKRYLKTEPSADTAMNALTVVEQKRTSGLGGIDLNLAQMSLQVKKDGHDFKFDFNGTEIDAVQVTGAMFTIRTMTPVINLPLVLGLNPEPAFREIKR